MTALFHTILTMSLKASIVILVVLLARLLLVKAPKKYSYLLWVIVAFRLCFPISLPSALSIFGVSKQMSSLTLPGIGDTPAVVVTTVPSYDQSLPPDVTAPSTPPSATTPEASAPAVTSPAATTPEGTSPSVTTPEGTSPSITTPAITEPSVTTPAATEPSVTTPAVTEPSTTSPVGVGPLVTTSHDDPTGSAVGSARSIDWKKVIETGIVSVWFLGVLTLITYAVLSYQKLHKNMKTAVRCEDNVFVSGSVDSPFALGFLRPKIFLPEGLTKEERVCILAHERYHLRRGDHIVKPFAYLLLCVYWFNPLCWLAFHLMSRDMEMSCDEKILSESNDAAFKKQYSLTLLSLASKRPLLSASPIAFSDGGGAKKRILHAINWKKPKLWISIVAVILCVITIVICATDAIVDRDDPDVPADPPITEYTAALQLQIEEFLNAPINNGFIYENFYTTLEEIDLLTALYDLGTPYTEWSEKEKEDILAEGFWDDYYVTAHKWEREYINDFLFEKTGLTLDNFGNEIPHFHYVEAYDAFYNMHNGTHYERYRVLDGILQDDGLLAIRYFRESNPKNFNTVTLRATASGFQFVSNVEGDKFSEHPFDYGPFIVPTDINYEYTDPNYPKENLTTVTFHIETTVKNVTVFDIASPEEPFCTWEEMTPYSHIFLRMKFSDKGLSYRNEDGFTYYYRISSRDTGTLTLLYVASDHTPQPLTLLAPTEPDPPVTTDPPVTDPPVTEPPVTEPPFITDTIAFHPHITITDIGDLDPMYLSGVSQGYACVVVCDDGESFVFVNTNGELLTQERFAFATSFDESGKALVQRKDGSWKYLNTDGELVSDAEANWGTPPDENMSYEENGMYGLLDENGNRLTDPIFTVPPAFYPYQSYAMATMIKGEDTVPVIVSRGGHIIELPEGTFDADVYIDRIVCYGIGYDEDQVDTVLDMTGKEILSERYSLVLPCEGKWFAVIQDGKLGLLDWDGNELIAPSIACDWSPDMRIGYGEGYLTVQIDGQLAFVKIVEPPSEPKPPLPEGTPLTAEQITEIENFLNKEENNGFISYTNEYAKPEDIDLWLVFYNIGTPSYLWSKEEQDGVLAAGIWDEYYVGTYKIEKSYADALLRKRTGLSLDDFGGTIPYFYYIEAYDAFYNMHSDTTYDPVWAIDGVIDENGNYVVRYKSALISNLCIVTLRKTDDGYQFISNLESDATLSDSSDFDWDYFETDEEVSTNVTHEYTDTASETTHKLLISAEKTIRNVTFFTVKKEEPSGANMPDKVLYRLETLSPDESLLIHTDLGVLTALRGFCFTGEDGFTYYCVMEYNEWEERYYLSRIAIRTQNSLLLPASTQQNPSALLEEPFLSILKNEKTFVYSDQEKHLSDFSFGIRSYTMVDFDSDGKNECVVEIADGTILILRNNGDRVIGDSRRVQAMYQINTDGTFYWNENAGDTQGCSRLQFSEDGYHTVEIELWRTERDENGLTYYVNGTPVSLEEFNAVATKAKTSVVWHPYSEISTEPSDSPFTLQFFDSYADVPSDNVLHYYDPYPTIPENSQLPFLVMVKETVKNVTFFTVDGANTELPEYTLKTWEELTPEKPLLIDTYLNDATIDRGISYTDENGTTYYYGFDCDLSGRGGQPYNLRLLDIDTSGTPLPQFPPVTFENYLSNEQLQEIETFLNAHANNGFVQLNTYYKPQDIDLNWAFYHGGGAGIPLEELTDEELRIFVSEGRSAFNLKTVMRRSDIDAFLRKVTGLSLDHFVEMDRNEFVYSEGLDAYFDYHTDSAFSVVMVLSGGIDENGNYVVYYEEGYGGVMVVTLRPTDDGYQFISNLPTDIELPTDPFEVDFKDPEEVTDTSGVHVYTDKEAATIDQLVQISIHQTVKDFALFELVERYNELVSSSYAPGKTLYTLDELTPDKPFLLQTSDDRRRNLGYRYTDENGYTYYYALSWGGLFDVSIGVVTAEPSTPAAPTDLTATQLQEIEDFLNDEENNGFVGTLNLYTEPDYLDLYWAFRDGAGIGVWDQDWSAEEKEAFNAIFGSGHNSRYLRIDRIDLTVHLLKKTGLDRQRFATTLHGFTYSEELDAYFTSHTDTEYHEVDVTGGYIDEYGTYVVHYDYYDDHCTVTLRKVKNGYQFLSNLCEGKTPNYPLFLWDASSSPDWHSTTYEYIEEIVDGSASSDYLLFHLRTPLKNVTYFALEGNTLTTLATWEELLPEDSLLIGTRVSDGTFTRGFSYDDESGVTRYFILHPSEEDHWLYTHHLALSNYHP